MSSSLPARTTDSQFEATSVLRETPTSTLYAGRHLRLGFDVALKVPKGKQARSIARRELLALRELHHPNSVRLLGVAQLELNTRKRPCLVLSLHHGSTLRQLLRVHRRLPAVRAIGIIRQVLGALQEAHRHGIAHGDIQPANVLVEEVEGITDRVVLIDYSAATSDEIESTERGRQTVYGTPFYTAPEVGLDGGATVRSDLYSVGVLLYEMLSGSRPSLMPTEPSRRFPPLRDVLPGNYQLGEVVDRAISNDPSARFPDATAFAGALSRLDLARLVDCEVGASASPVPATEVDTVEIEIPEGERYLDVAPSANDCPPDLFPLQSSGRPTVWVLEGDEDADRPAVREALELVATMSDVTRLNKEARAAYVSALRDQNMRSPWVVVFGQSHVDGSDPLVGWLSEHRSEISRLLISQASDLTQIQQVIEGCGMDHHTVVPADARRIALDLRQMIERARALRLHYDALRIGWRDARDDLQALTREAFNLAASTTT